MPEPTNQPNRENQESRNGPKAPQQESQQESGLAVLVLLSSPRFELGQLVATPGALAALEQANTSMAELIGRHLSGDWGTVDEEDWAANDRALLEGTRLLSTYALPATDETVWVITEWDRSATTILLPSGAP